MNPRAPHSFGQPPSIIRNDHHLLPSVSSTAVQYLFMLYFLLSHDYIVSLKICWTLMENMFIFLYLHSIVELFKEVSHD